MLRNTPFLLLNWLIAMQLLLPLALRAQELDRVPGNILVRPLAGITRSEFASEVQRLAQPPLRISSVCSRPFPVWLIQIDAAVQNEYLLLETLRRHRMVETAQFNFFISNRLIPDDPHFFSQWQYINIGGSNSTIDADFDADEAWDISIGGLTSADGDTIVVCMIDEGLDQAHPDLYANLWFNHSEIPNNNIDDDGNGYVDDYKGWNVNTQNDNLVSNPNAGWHGTPVAGVIGAVGNNGIGVCGINWNVKIMTVIRGNTMDQTLAAYAYPFVARKKYNDTNGAQGAFVVATNSSWGIDFGQPEEAPLWCSFYDSLGIVGILNAAATANGNYNIDQVGDLPTACGSDFLLTVTNINATNQKHPNAAYGLNTIDLGAYGTDIWSVKKNNSYGSFTGTSAASPAVAGAIALLYAAPCPDISWYAKSNPAATALLMKGYLLDGATPEFSLSNLTLSGGRLNLKSAMDLVMDNCAYADCFTPAVIHAPVISDNSALISWLTAPNTNYTDFRYRKVGTSMWTIIYGANNPYYIFNLETCTTYEYQLNSVCASGESGYSLSYTFQTLGCCEAPTDFTIESVDENEVTLTWPGSTGVSVYNTRYRMVGASIWIESSTPSAFLHLSNLVGCTEYEVEVQPICNNNTTIAFSAPFIWQTSSCDNCLEYNYCPITLDPIGITWINQVQLNDLENSSTFGANGYSDFTGMSATLYAGISYEVSLNTGYDFLQIPMYFFVWMDWNQDGIFGNEELLLNSLVPQHSCTADIHIPFDAVSGTTRLRILASASPLSACGESNIQGEAEDYCVTILENTTCAPPQSVNWKVDDNQLTISWLAALISDNFQVRYRALAAQNWQIMMTNLHYVSLEGLAPCTDYEFQIRSECNGEHSLYTTLQSFRTTGCAPCLDLAYCEPQPGNTNFEWIGGFSINNLHQSSNGDGYSDFSNHNSTELIRSNNYPLEITAVFSGDAYDEHYSVWIDFNQDGTFDDLTEKVFQTLEATDLELVTGSCFIPPSALEGATRMRVMMRYNLPAESACTDEPYFGEVEDYCVSILSNLSQACSSPFEVFATAITDSSAYVEWAGNTDLNAYQFRYRPLFEDWIVFTGQNTFLYLDQLLPCEEYEYQLRSLCQNGMSAYSEIQSFVTECSTTATTHAIRPGQPMAYPNPFSDQLHVLLPGHAAEVVDIQIINMLGASIGRFADVVVTDEKLILDLSDLPTGVYFLEITGGIVLKVMHL
jgi:serine protease